MVGGGLVNWGEHAHLEATLITSAAESRFTPYGGIRAMQVFPLNKGAVHDSPTLGGFIGARLGTRTAGISPELGVFYDNSALRIPGDFPSFLLTLHGDFARFLCRVAEQAHARRYSFSPTDGRLISNKPFYFRGHERDGNPPEINLLAARG